MQTKASLTFHMTDDTDIDAMLDVHDAAARDTGRGRRRGGTRATGGRSPRRLATAPGTSPVRSQAGSSARKRS
jgi:hypothetical protein